MKNLTIEKLIIISQAQNKAKTIEFDSKLTVLNSQDEEGNSINRTGKSLVIKSIFHAFGAALKQYTVNWDDMNLCTILYFSLDYENYRIYRNGNKLVLIDNKQKSIKFDSLKELKDYYVNFFDFNIKLIEGKNNKANYLYPGAIFMPFYIDQDQGWNGEWDSFKDIYQGSWKKEILLFHLGVKPNQYYNILDEQAMLTNKNLEQKTKYKMLESFCSNQIERNADILDINVNIDSFASEIDSLTEELNRQLEIKNSIKFELIDCFNKMEEIEELYKNARNNLSELVEDIEYINDSVSDEHIVCPTCGTIHDNSISHRFMMFTEIEECNSVISNYFEEKAKIEKRINDNEKKIGTLTNYIEKISSILSKKRNNVSFNDVIKSEGARTVISDLKADLLSLKEEIEKVDGRLRAITKEKAQITKDGKDILESYASALMDNLLFLDVNDIDKTKLNKFSSTLRCGGNDTPTAILAQVFALNQIALQYSNSIISPIVLDAIFQQEPAKSKIGLIWDFIKEKQPKGSQLIISTTEMHDALPTGKIITLLDERALLSKEDYQKVENEANMFKALLLS